MAGGWTRDGAVQDQIDDTVNDAVEIARVRMSAGEGLTHCEECGEEIPAARRKALPGARTCVPCQSGRDTKASVSLFNRRGSKDSQLR
ncbi:DksA/TraR family C4-type zinc finger protein [Sphingobium limneticum]|uniref:DksA/TraR family C4-type zinc finger protein n=1 Tax=Sphingobium limneticum TaxID=1007511 RepID=A0A5J5I947_9SPHN|nr:DksA/TraR family C4-type zinc finger protein [Sphingobium limneticum]KAA9019624.1 DksA/TraR family C4-type zinc finger protein [Sphingobium limneticum]KAA9032345.1 DksA/TraR family C4-type zinc finger protein [Sphingobium limneticum]